MATSTEISFGLFDVTAKPDSAPTCPNKQPFVDIDQLKLDAVTAPAAATLEHNFWLLDGTFGAFPDEPETKTWGLWSKTMSNALGQLSKSAAIPNFSRASVAYKNDGSQVASDVPRFEAGKFDNGVHMEEGTVNKLGVEGTDSLDWTAWIHWGNRGYWSSESQSVDPTYGKVYAGVAAAGTVYLFKEDSSTITSGSIYTLTIWLKSSIPKTVRLRGYSYKTVISEEERDVNLTTSWQKFTFTFSALESAANAQVGVRIYPAGIGTIIYAARPQFEEKAYSTSPTNNSRSADSLYYSLPNPLPAEWLMSGVWKPDQGSTINKNLTLANPYYDTSNQYQLQYTGINNKLQFYKIGSGAHCDSDALTYNEGDIIEFSIAQTTQDRGDLSAGMHLWYRINNGPVVHISNTDVNLLTAPTKVYIGCLHDNGYEANGIIDAVKLIDIAAEETAGTTINQAWAEAQLTRTEAPTDETKTAIALLNFDDTLQPADMDFIVPPIITIEFTGNHSSMGVSFEFDPYGNNYPDSINIKWYGNGGTVLLADQDFNPDGWRYSAIHTVENYNKLVISFYGMSAPYRYLKLQKINYGVYREFKTNEVIDANILEEINPISAELSINTLNFRLHSPDAEFNILNPQGIYSLLQQRQPLVVVERTENATMPMGTFFLDEWDSPTENTAIMTAMDAIGIMDGTTFYGGIYVSESAAVLMTNILEDASFGYDIHSSYTSMTVSGWLPVSSHREALQQVAFAVGAVVDTSRSDIVRVYPLPTAVAGTITKDRKFTGGSVKQRGLVTGVEVTAHTYVESAEAVELFNGNLLAGEHEISFAEPAHDLSITGATILSSNCNYARISVTAPDTVVLSGARYIDTTQIAGVYMNTLPAGGKENILKVEDATLVSGTNAQAIAQRVYNYYQRRIEQTVSMVLETEQVGQIVEVETLYNELRAGAIESLETDLTGGFRTKAVIVGE